MKLHQKQAKREKEIMGLSQMVKERVKAKALGLPIDLMQRGIKIEAPERQELHKLTGAQHTKQDEIPRMGKLGTCHGYYLFMEDDSGCLIEQEDEEGNVRYVKDMDTNQILPMDRISEAEARTYQIPEEDQQQDNAETISSTLAADYD